MAETSLIAEPGKQDVVISRVFDAPRDLVFKACTDPELISQWWGPKAFTTTVDAMDVRPGGTWRYVQRGAGGEDYGFHGAYHDVTPPERLIYTFEFEPMPGHVALETVTLEDLDGRTKVTDRVVYQTVEDRDGTLQSGMEEGMNETMDRFTELVEEMQKE
ncbi:SRPBCC family protein [Methanoculleus sp.]|uniref:SRPBCC family protein n=1 Tax=Methanoculleus sp. TaxID=90427 RepID=UPI001BD59F1F|nr:SRPBCC family protein [Methanoculleus sp.]